TPGPWPPRADVRSRNTYDGGGAAGQRAPFSKEADARRRDRSMTRRWAPLVVASALTALLAIGAAVGADQVVERGAGASQPRLRTVPASTLARLGLTLSSTAQPPYCNL